MTLLYDLAQFNGKSAAVLRTSSVRTTRRPTGGGYSFTGATEGVYEVNVVPANR